MISTHIKEFNPFIPHGHDHAMMTISFKKFSYHFHKATTMLFVSKSSREYLKMPCCHTYWPQPTEHVREIMLRITHRNARWSSQIRTKFVTSQDYQTHKRITEEGNLYGPIRTGHNQHTHTDNISRPEPQLKSSSCSSAIPSHNSREVIPGHNPSRLS